MYLVFPIVGWVADSCLGRYKVITAFVYIYISLVIGILQAIAYTILATYVFSCFVKLSRMAAWP